MIITLELYPVATSRRGGYPGGPRPPPGGWPVELLSCALEEWLPVRLGSIGHAGEGPQVHPYGLTGASGSSGGSGGGGAGRASQMAAVGLSPEGWCEGLPT